MRKRLKGDERICMVTIEYRLPRSREESKLYGQTKFHSGNTASIFINSRKRRSGEPLNTFFHELTHVWLELFSNIRLNSSEREEVLSRQVGAAVEGIFTLK